MAAETAFDAYVMVDWSASSTPKRGKDSIWAAWGVRDSRSGRFSIESANLPTREEATARVLELLAGFLGQSRVLVGFDFPYGYPRGFASGLGLGGEKPPWRATWEHLAAKIEDDRRNRNNRFEVAAELNRSVGSEAGPFWGCPASRSGPDLSTKKPVPGKGEPGRLAESRLAERRFKEARFGSIQLVWKLFYAGSVGSQCLVGIPRLLQLRDRPRLVQDSVVWPFETGFALPEDRPLILHAEIWPGLLRGEYRERGAVKDEAQVRSLVRYFVKRDAAGRRPAFFGRPEGLTDAEVDACVEEEGWTLGTPGVPGPSLTGRGVGVRASERNRG